MHDRLVTAFAHHAGGPATRLVIAVAGLGGMLTAASFAVPRAAGAPTPFLLDLAVPVVLLAVAVGIARWPVPAVLLAAAAAIWSGTGLSGHLPSWLGALVERAAAWPHSAVVVAVLCLPFGTVGRTRRFLAASAGAVAVLGFLGVGGPVFAFLGLVLVAAAATWWRGLKAVPVRWTVGTQLVVGAGWMAVPLLVGAVGVRVLADIVDLLLVLSALMVSAIERLTGQLKGTVADELGRRVGAVLGTGPVVVHFPLGAGYVDVTGLPAFPDEDSSRILEHGREVARLSPAADVPDALGGVLARDLAPVAAIAGLSHERRQLATEIAASRRRLAMAAEGERARAGDALTRTVLARLDRIEECLGDDAAIADRLGRLRDELGALVAGLDPLRGRTLAEALRTLGTGPDVVVAPDLDAPATIARAAWWIASESVANARKHAPGARVVVSASRDEQQLIVRVTDDGPGGADSAGRGLLGITDRAAVVDGTLTVRSDDTGTVVEGRLPCASTTGTPVVDSRAGADPPTPPAFLASSV